MKLLTFLARLNITWGLQDKWGPSIVSHFRTFQFFSKICLMSTWPLLNWVTNSAVICELLIFFWRVIQLLVFFLVHNSPNIFHSLFWCYFPYSLLTGNFPTTRYLVVYNLPFWHNSYSFYKTDSLACWVSTSVDDNYRNANMNFQQLAWNGFWNIYFLPHVLFPSLETRLWGSITELNFNPKALLLQ